jgi:hypothetical protein
MLYLQQVLAMPLVGSDSSDETQQIAKVLAEYKREVEQWLETHQ